MELGGLNDRLVGDVVLPGDETWEAARQAWNLAADQRPVAVVYPESADDVVATVRFATEQGLRIAFNAGRPQRGPDRLEPGHAAAQDGADGRDRDRRRPPPRARRGGGAVEAARGRGRRARPRVPRRHLAQRRRPRLCAGRWPELDDPDPRARLQHDHRGRGGDRRRPPRQDGPRDRARAVLGDPRRRGQRGRGDRDRGRAVPGRRDLRRGPVLADRARVGGPARLARMDRDRARGLRVARPDAPAARRPVPPRERPRPVVRAGGGGDHRERRRRRKRSSGRCATSGPRSTPSRPCRRASSASCTWIPRTRSPIRARGS